MALGHGFNKWAMRENDVGGLLPVMAALSTGKNGFLYRKVGMSIQVGPCMRALLLGS